MKTTLGLLTITTLLVGSTAFAQTSTAPMSAPVQKPGMVSRMLHRGHTTSATTSGAMSTPIPGGIVGNKRTHVYHMASDKGLPSAKNRVYFKSIAEAQAAGYHASGTSMKRSAKTGPARNTPAAPPAPTAAPGTPNSRGYVAPTPGVSSH